MNTVEYTSQRHHTNGTSGSGISEQSQYSNQIEIQLNSTISFDFVIIQENNRLIQYLKFFSLKLDCWSIKKNIVHLFSWFIFRESVKQFFNNAWWLKYDCLFNFETIILAIRYFNFIARMETVQIMISRRIIWQKKQNLILCESVQIDQYWLFTFSFLVPICFWFLSFISKKTIN